MDDKIISLYCNRTPTFLHRRRIYQSGLFLITIASLMISTAFHVRAQLIDSRWSEPLQLSSPDADAGVPSILADPYGNVHAFWPEFNALDRRPTIQYSRFNGTQWTVPQDIYAGRAGDDILALNVTLAADDRLHLTWIGSQTGPINYISAPVSSAGIARGWSDPVRIDVPAFQAFLHSDANNSLHLIYSVYFGNDRGVYYTRSDDQAISWSAAQPLDLLRPPNFSTQSLKVVTSDSGEFHIVWWNKDPEFFGRETGLVQYIHSLDGGKTWSQPFVIAGGNSGTSSLLGFASPNLAYHDGEVVVMWAEGDLPYRKSRYSPDGGINWTAANNVQSFGELHGQAFDTMTVDGLGRIHYFADIRYPQGLYHAIWDRERWLSPEMIYNIQPDGSGNSTDTSVHAHNLQSAALLGNQLVVTMMDPPSAQLRRLFVISRTLPDIPQTQALPTSTPLITPSPTPTLPPTPAPTLTSVWTDEMQAQAPPIPDNIAPSTPIVIPAVVVGLIIVGAVVFRLRNTRK
jgi:hypothetical protein